MSADRLIAAHEPTWIELERLQRADQLPPGRLHEMLRLHRAAATHLAQARELGDAALIQRLTSLVAASQARLERRRPRPSRVLRRFFSETFPAAVWFHRRYIVVAGALFFTPAVLVAAWMATSSDALEASAPASVREAYLERDFENYYSSDPAAQFATEVFINNIQVAILAFAVGILLCIPTAWVLIQNGALIGLAAGLFTAAGRWQHFWGLITPHGLLEVSAILVAGAAGFGLGWAVIAPGDRPRRAAVSEAGTRSVVVIIGLVLAFLVAGMIEGFVTGSDLPTPVRVGVGVAAASAFAGWVVILGPPAAARGPTGRFGEGPDGTHATV